MAQIKRLPQRWVLPLSLIGLFLPIIIMEYPIMSYTNGALVYPMDDAFIHMSIAKNLALHGVWGVSRYEFVSASSSILYPLILAAFFLVTGPNVLIPLLVNLIAGIILIIAIQRWLRRQDISPLRQLMILLAAIFFIPLPFIIRLGMEHTLQILFCFLFIFSFADWLVEGIRSEQKQWKYSWKIFIYGALVTAIRFEGIFLIFIACLFLLYYRQVELSFELGVISLLPVLIFGIFSMSRGNYFLPNPVLLKSVPLPMTPAAIVSFLTHGVFQKIYYFYMGTSIVALQRLLFLLPMAYCLFHTHFNKEEPLHLILIFIIAATFMHIVFANTNWFYRYEAYLIGLSIVIVGVLFAKFGIRNQLQKVFRNPWLALPIALLLAFPFILRSEEAFKTAKPACLNIYDQDYHVGHFLHKYYDTTRIGFNDLGCSTYYTSAKSLDLVGLGNIEVARSIKQNYYNTAFLDLLVKKEEIKIIVVFDRLLSPLLLKRWHKIATWHFDHMIIPGDEDLNFYAVDSTMGPALKRNLMAYQTFLPTGVTIRY